LISENFDDYPKFKANTGSYTSDLVDEMEAMMAANAFYLIKNNKYIRCHLIKSNKTISDTLENLYDLEFEFRYSLK